MSNIAPNTAKNSIQAAVPFQIEPKVDAQKVVNDFSSVMRSEKNSRLERLNNELSKNKADNNIVANKYEYRKIKQNNNDLAGTLGVQSEAVKGDNPKVMARFEVLSEDDLNEDSEDVDVEVDVELSQNELEQEGEELSPKDSKIAQLLLAMVESEKNSKKDAAAATSGEDIDVDGAVAFDSKVAATIVNAEVSVDVEDVEAAESLVSNKPIQKYTHITKELLENLKSILQNMNATTIEEVNDEALFSGIKELVSSVQTLADDALLNDNLAVDEDSFSQILAKIEAELAKIAAKPELANLDLEQAEESPEVTITKFVASIDESINRLRTTMAQFSQESIANKQVKDLTGEEVKGEKISEQAPKVEVANKVEVSKEQIQAEAPKVAATVVAPAKPILENVKVEDVKVSKSESPLSHMAIEEEGATDTPDTFQSSTQNQNNDNEFKEPAQKQANTFETVMKDAPKLNVQELKESVAKQEAYNMREAKDITKLVKLIESQSTKGESKLTVTLTPENLGRLEVRLSEIGGKVSAKFFTDNETSHKMMLSQSEALRNQLSEKGIVIDNMEFAFNDTTSKEQTGQEERRAKRQNGNKGGFKDNEESANSENESKPKGVYA